MVTCLKLARFWWWCNNIHGWHNNLCRNYRYKKSYTMQATPVGMLKEIWRKSWTLRNNKKWNWTSRNVDRFKKKQNGYTINENWEQLKGLLRISYWGYKHGEDNKKAAKRLFLLKVLKSYGASSGDMNWRVLYNSN